MLKSWYWTLCISPLLILAMASGCQTTKKDDGKRMMPAARIVFHPYTRHVPIQAGESQYPNLFTGGSYAVWGQNLTLSDSNLPGNPPKSENGGGDTTMALETMDAALAEDPESPMKADSKAKTTMAATNTMAKPVMIQCYLESQFPDMSIAYDAVGLRGMQFHLALPDGGEILPVQKVLDSNLEESPAGALRRYGRHITLYFPGTSIMVDNPAVNPASRGVRLVLEGHNSAFYFEWPAAPDLNLTARKPGLDDKGMEATKAAYRNVSTRVKKFSHEVD